MDQRRGRKTVEQLGEVIDVARGLEKADLVVKNATYLNVFTGEWNTGDIALYQGQIVGISESYAGRETIDASGLTVVPGFIDSHVHIESTLMTPSQYEKVVLPRGTTGAIVDPHEIVNVLGEKGFEYFLECADKSTMDIFVMLSSCVPATTDLETSGAKIGTEELLKYKDHPQVLGLAEMMNFPGVLFKDPEVLKKLEAFQETHIDGHCPMLRGKDLNAYIAAGIRTCHESIALDEAKEKLEKGMVIQLREGSVAKNLKDLCGLLNSYSSPSVTLATDDRNPVDILDEGHIDYLIRLAIESGIPSEVVYRCASWSVAKVYGLNKTGAIAPGYMADLVLLSDREKVEIHSVYKSGKLIQSERDIPSLDVPPPSGNSMKYVTPQVNEISISGHDGKFRVIEVIPDQIVTRSLEVEIKTQSGEVRADIDSDILKIAVKERHGNHNSPSVGLVRGFGFKAGAIGSSVGHDSHNAVVVGTNDEDMIACFEWLKQKGGGFVAIVDGKIIGELPLPIAGLMTDDKLESIYDKMSGLRVATEKMGCQLTEPFLQLAFLCLPVIPTLKITDRGLVDVDQFELVDVQV